MAKPVAQNDGGNLLHGSSWFERDYLLFRKAGLLINESNEITFAELFKHSKKFIPKTISNDDHCITRSLRLFKKTSLINIIKRDIDSKSTLEEILSSLTSLAEICIQAALVESMKYYLNTLKIESDELKQKSELMIIAMGKLGGEELNASSDIDIIFYSPYKDTLKKPPENLEKFEKFWNRVISRFINNLSASTEFGFVYRVDTRLRPYGNAGPQVVSESSLNSYFINTASDWERYAWLKARICTTQIFLDKEDFRVQKYNLERVIKEFLFRPFADFRIANALRKINRRIIDSNQKKRKNKDFSFDLKKDFGGIRTIEFIVQYFQLLKGGYHRNLQTPSLKTALVEIDKNKLLEPTLCNDLVKAYSFLRRLENLIQYQEDRQTHVFNEHLPCLNAFLDILNFEDFDTLKKHLVGHISNVKLIYEKIFSDNPNLSESRGKTVRKKATGEQENKSKIEKDKDLYLLKLHEKIKGRKSYLSLLHEKPEIEQELIRLNKRSPWIGSFIIQHPKLIEQLLNDSFYKFEVNPSELIAQTRDEMERIRQASPSDVEQSLNIIRDVYHINLLKILVGGLNTGMSIVNISDRLAILTEVIVNITFDFSLRFSKMEWLKDDLAIISYGKLGTREMDVGSDLDLIFLTNNLKTVHQEDTYRLIKRFISWIELRTFSGSLFKIDTALRPNGTTGLLVSSINSFIDYQNNKAWSWEHQALTKARFLIGSTVIKEKFDKLRTEVLMKNRIAESLQEEILSMRLLMMEKRKKKQGSTYIDIKHDKGGLIDIEFIVQYVILSSASKFPYLCNNVGNFSLLKAISELKLLPPLLTRTVSEIFVKYRELVHANRLNNFESLVKSEIVITEREKVNELWKITFKNSPKKIRPLSQIHSKIK